MQDEASFLKAIALEPENDVPRLVYADWLEEQGDQNRADLIRLQCNMEKWIDFRTGQPVDEKCLAELKVLEKSCIREMLRPREPSEPPGIRELTPELVNVIANYPTRISFKRGMINNLNLYQTKDIKIPTAFYINGKLNLQASMNAELPSDMHVRGDLDMAFSSTTLLPPRLRVDGNLNLSSTSIRQLPADLHVGGELNLTNTLIAPHEARLILTMPNLSDRAKFTGLESAGCPLLADQVRRKAGKSGHSNTPLGTPDR